MSKAKEIIRNMLPILKVAYTAMGSETELGDPNCQCDYCKIYNEAKQYLEEEE